MATFTTKFDVGDTVFTIANDRLFIGVINKIKWEKGERSSEPSPYYEAKSLEDYRTRTRAEAAICNEERTFRTLEDLFDWLRSEVEVFDL